jgi:RND family efflux transporter MFP subunit
MNGLNVGASFQLARKAVGTLKTCPYMCIVIAALGLGSAGCDEKHPQVVATPAAVVLVSQPVERTVTDYQVFTARTQAVQSVDIKARVTGYLTKILFKDGDEVKEGETLFQIDDRPYKATLDQAMATVEIAKAALIKAQADYDIGLNVQKQNPGAISEQELTKRLGARDEAKGNIALANANVESADLNYNWCKVTAPISGLANRHFIDVGNMTTKDTTVLTNVVSFKPVWAYFDVDEDSARRYQKRVEMGEVKSLRKYDIPVTLAVGSDESFPVKGSTDFVSNQVDPNTGTIRVRAVFPNDDGTLLAGMFARIRVPISAQHQALLVADAAIGTNQGQRFVMIVNEKSEVEYHVVDVGQMHGGLREVIRYRTVTETGADGKDVTKRVEVLKPTDRVIVDGLQRVRPGVKVDPHEVDMVTLLPATGKSSTPPKNGKAKQ